MANFARVCLGIVPFSSLRTAPRSPTATSDTRSPSRPACKYHCRSTSFTRTTFLPCTSMICRSRTSCCRRSRFSSPRRGWRRAPSRSSRVPAGVGNTSFTATNLVPSRVLSSKPATLPAAGPVATATSLRRPWTRPFGSVISVPSRRVRLACWFCLSFIDGRLQSNSRRGGLEQVSKRDWMGSN